jgi:Mg-chelatase subunit ChlD
MFLGLAVDVGFAWVMKSILARSVDAAALAGMRNTSLGTSQATSIAQSAFNSNYGSGMNRDASTPVVSINVTTDANNNSVVNVTATATINTFFIRILPGFGTLKISANAQATRPKLVMSIILDKSGSMTLNGGSTALGPAVTNFIGYFDNVSDQVAMISFQSISNPADVTMRTSFKTPITNAVNAMVFGGGTFSDAGLRNGQTQITNVPVVAGQNVVKVAVFFTDGWANTINNQLNCPAKTNLNFGGCAPPESAVNWCGTAGPPLNVFWIDPNSGSTLAANSCTAATFPLASNGANQVLNQTNVATEAAYRSVQAAIAMRNLNIVVYSIGLGDKISQSFLQQVANDPASATFDSSKPVGQAVFAPTSADLQSVFQTIASKILLRMSQ